MISLLIISLVLTSPFRWRGTQVLKSWTPSSSTVKLVSTNFTNLVPVEQFHHKPVGMYDGGLLKLAPGWDVYKSRGRGSNFHPLKALRTLQSHNMDVHISCYQNGTADQKDYITSMKVKKGPKV